MKSRLAIAAGASGVLGGWLAIMPASTLSLSLRFSEWNQSDSGQLYAITLATGWLTLIVALIAAGLWGDYAQKRSGSRVLLVQVGIPLLAAAGALLGFASNPLALIFAWALLQIPAALLVTTSLAIVGMDARSQQRRFASGLIGAAPILALLIGSLGVRALENQPTLALMVPVILGAIMAAPLLRVTSAHTSSHLDGEERLEELKAGGVSVDRVPVGGVSTDRVENPTLRAVSAWGGFLVAAFLLSWATSTANGFVVVFVRDSFVVGATETATNAIVLASVLALAASIATGLFGHGALRALKVWSVAATLCAVALALIVLVPGLFGILLGAAIFGIAFGLANGTEFAVVLAIRGRTPHLGRDLGSFTSITSAPYVLVPAFAAVWLSQEWLAGTSGLFVLAAIAALAAFAAALFALARLRTSSAKSRRSPAPQQ